MDIQPSFSEILKLLKIAKSKDLSITRNAFIIIRQYMKELMNDISYDLMCFIIYPEDSVIDDTAALFITKHTISNNFNHNNLELVVDRNNFARYLKSSLTVNNKKIHNINKLFTKIEQSSLIIIQKYFEIRCVNFLRDKLCLITSATIEDHHLSYIYKEIPFSIPYNKDEYKWENQNSYPELLRIILVKYYSIYKIKKESFIEICNILEMYNFYINKLGLYFTDKCKNGINTIIDHKNEEAAVKYLFKDYDDETDYTIDFNLIPNFDYSTIYKNNCLFQVAIHLIESSDKNGNCIDLFNENNKFPFLNRINYMSLNLNIGTTQNSINEIPNVELDDFIITNKEEQKIDEYDKYKSLFSNKPKVTNLRILQNKIISDVNPTLISKLNELMFTDNIFSDIPTIELPPIASKKHF